MPEEIELIARITFNPEIFGGKPIIRGHRLAVEHVLGMLAAGDTAQTLLDAYSWLEPVDVQACLIYVRPLQGLKQELNSNKFSAEGAVIP